MTNTTAELCEPDNPAAWALAQHIADHPVSTIQAAFRYLNTPLTLELREAPAVVEPPADQPTRRDRIAEILRAHANLGGAPLKYALPFFDGATPSLPRISGWKPLDDVVGAVLAVLPSAADWDALVREADNQLTAAEADLAAVETALGDTLVPAAREEALAGIAAVLPEPTDRAAEDLPLAATCSAQYHGAYQARLCIRAAQHQRTAHTDEHGFHWSDTVAVYPVADGTFRTGTDVRDALRRMADETATTETPTVPVQHAPGKVICCADCRAKGYAVCLDEPAAGVRQDGAES